MAGRFVWYDLMTTDLEGGLAFYAKVLGWSSVNSGMPGPTYMVISAGPIPVAGSMQLTPQMQAQGARPAWIGYVAVDDVDATAAQAVSLGGAVHVPPQDIPGVGRFAMIADPHGAVINLFKPNPAYPQPPEAPAGTPGHTGWRELLAVDWPSAFDFHSALFGWTKGDAVDIGPMGTYQLFKATAEADTGGMFNKPAEVPVSFWLYYFNVKSVAAAIPLVKAGGGAILMGPMQVPGGSWIVQCLDPQGAMFALTSEQA
jgi:predicted enzyme related to lactoylglutathione lyase